MFSEDTDCNADGYKFLTKAIGYFQKNGGKLLKYQHKLQGQSGEYLYQILKCNPSLIVLSFKHIFLTLHDAKAIGKVLTTFADIRELDLTDTNITVAHGKEIADGLIKAKKLEYIKIGQNKELDPTQIIYNLAFTPNVKYIDLQGNLKAKNSQTAEALYKLIKISVSIESLQLANTSILNILSPEFFQALGESRTIKYLNFNLTEKGLQGEAGTNPGLQSNLGQLGRACAMNAYREGALTHLCLEGNFVKPLSLASFLGSLWISDKDHEETYGEKSVASEMKQDQLTKKLHCGLEHLSADFGDLVQNVNFKELDKQKAALWPHILHVLGKTKLANLQLSNCKIGPKTLEVYTRAIGHNPLQACTSLKILNLRGNPLTKDGAKLLSSAMEQNASIENLDLSQCQLKVFGVQLLAQSLCKNRTLKTLNLFKNTFDVAGAKEICELLKKNETLEFLDIGHNRIRQKGLEYISEGLAQAPNSGLKTLGLRMNFINDFGFTSLFNDLIFQGSSKLENLYINLNNLS